MEDSKSVNITANNSVVITPVDNNTELNNTLYAINWFNVRRLWMYNLYNVLVASHLKRVSGTALYKGIGTERLLIEDQEIDRRMLLLVMYPSADAFLKLVSNKLFLLKSMLRNNSVKDFCIAFSKRLDEGRLPEISGLYKGSNFYMAHVFKHKNAGMELPEIPARLSCFFYGQKTAIIGRKSGSREVINANFPIESVIIWESESRDELLEFFNGSDYTDFRKRTGLCNVYIQKRVL